MKYIINIFIALLVITNIKSLIRFIRVKRYIIKFKDEEIKLKNKKKIKVIIPVYNEVKNIKKSIEYFKKLEKYCDVYYVTTSKERKMKTYKEVEKQIEIQKANNIFLDNCPNTEGTMANQLNYMAKKLPKNEIIAIYNIDSFPDIKAFKYVLNNIKDNELYQQVSYFDDYNMGILRSAQNWQNRWSLIYELGKYTKKSGGNNFVYTIGHGLFLNRNILEKYGYWSENEINEDNEFGYRMLCNGLQIKPIPFLEQAGFANTLKIYIKQQATWVNGPLYAFSYYKKSEKKSIKNLYLAILNFKAFLSWVFFPIIFLSILFISMFYNYTYSIVLLFLIFIYISIFNFLASKLLMKLGYKRRQRCFINIIYDYLFFIVHSFGGFITISKILRRKNNKENKYNTEK